MAKKTASEEERTIKVKAKVNLKYDEDVIEIGKDFNIRESDLEEMRKNNYVDYTPTVQQSQQQQTVPPKGNALPANN